MNILYHIVVILHFSFMIFITFGWISDDRNILKVLLLLQITCILLFIIFRGCIVTKLEMYLSPIKNKFTIVDPLLQLLKFQLTNKNRYMFTLVMYFLTISITICKIYLFFKKSIKNK